MNVLMLKNILREELNIYNYTFGIRLLCYHLNDLLTLYTYDKVSCKKIDEFILFSKSSFENGLENIKDGIDILCGINNSHIIIKLLCFLNPSLYGDLNKK